MPRRLKNFVFITFWSICNHFFCSNVFCCLFSFYRRRLTQIHTCTHTQAVFWCDLQHLQAGIQLLPCQWSVQPSGCTSLRFSLQPPSSLSSITASTSGALSDVKRHLPPRKTRSFNFYVTFAKYVPKQCAKWRFPLLVRITFKLELLHFYFLSVKYCLIFRKKERSLDQKSQPLLIC